MTQNELWQFNYDATVAFMEKHKRRPSKYKEDERSLCNWLKHNRKLYVAGSMDELRRERFERLLLMLKQLQRVNQYAYVNEDVTTEQISK